MTGGNLARRLTAIAVAGLVCGIVLLDTAGAQTIADAARLNAEVLRLHQAGKYAQATEIAKRVVAIYERQLGPGHRDVGTALNNLAELYRIQGRAAEAEPLFRRGLAIRERALGPGHPDVAQTLNNLAWLYQVQGRYPESESSFRRGIAIIEKALGPGHPSMAAPLNNLAEMYRAQNRHTEAEPLYRRSLAIAEKALGPAHPGVLQLSTNLGLLYLAQGRFNEAEALYRRNLAIAEKASGPQHPSTAAALNGLGKSYQGQGRHAEAEPLLRRSLTIVEKVLGSEHLWVATALNDLAELYRDQGCRLAIIDKAEGPEHPDATRSLSNQGGCRAQSRHAEAESLYRRSLAIREKVLGPAHADVAESLNNLGLLYHALGRYPDAETLHRRSLTIREKALGAVHLSVAWSLNNLGILYQTQGRYPEAEALYRRGLPIMEKALGPEHPAVATLLSNLAVLYQAQDRYFAAEPLDRRSLAIREKTLGPEHADVGQSLNNLALLAYLKSDWARAADYWRRSTGIIKRHAERGGAGDRTGASGGEAQQLGWQFWGLIKATHRLPAQSPTAIAEMFEAAQWAQASQAAASLAQMAARSAKGSPQLAGLVRERQDLVSEWQTKDKLLIAAKGGANRKTEAETALAGRLAAIDKRLTEIDRRFARDFPDFAALASPAPASLGEVQAQLRADEALVLFLDIPAVRRVPEESFIWVVTRTDVRWVRSGLGTAALGREVAALRCGLDETAWVGEGAQRCANASGMATPVRGTPNPLPFDHARAHKLYLSLFAEVHHLIRGKHLLIVPSGPLTQLPFQVLVTEAPPATGIVAWLARSHAVSILPAVSSLKALRRVARPSTAPRPMIGFGNPLLDGNPRDADDAARATLARAKQRCPDTDPQRVAAGARGGLARAATRGGVADLTHLKMQTPLPETADELCRVARDMKADTRDLRLGAQATEREVRRLSASGELAKYRMVHFATHGVLAGELRGADEPGLILTPEKASTEDDGYLSASEIAALKLDADWVVLSACNTAAGAAHNADALSGLARAFIYAQARALLVSHWAVDSDATVRLITGTVSEMARDAKVGRSEALRRAMLVLIDNGAQHEAHPAHWAPFVVVGEGAAR